MRRLEISFLLILTLRRTSPSKFMCLINRVSIQIIIIMIKNTWLLSLFSITTNCVHLMAAKFRINEFLGQKSSKECPNENWW